MTRAAMVVLAVIVASALLAGVIESVLGVSHDSPDLAMRHCAAAWPHVLGCDDIGQDLFTRLLFGARVSLAVGLCAAALSTCAGAAVGFVAGMNGGVVDAVSMRVVDAMLAIPVLPLLLLVSAATLGGSSGPSSTAKLVVILAAFGWMTVARVSRAEALRIKNLDYCVAARALGARSVHIVIRHLLPYALPPLIVAAALDVGKNILAEAALSFLGLGVQPPTPSWGNMLRHAESAIQSDPASAFWPGSCILLTVACIHVLGEGLRSALDPRSR